jgi:hypothetical protein
MTHVCIFSHPHRVSSLGTLQLGSEWEAHGEIEIEIGFVPTSAYFSSNDCEFIIFRTYDMCVNATNVHGPVAIEFTGQVPNEQ